MVVWEFGAGIRVRFWVMVGFGIRIICDGFGFGIGGRFSVGGGGGRCGGGVGFPSGFAVVAAGHPAAVKWIGEIIQAA